MILLLPDGQRVNTDGLFSYTPANVGSDIKTGVKFTGNGGGVVNYEAGSLVNAQTVAAQVDNAQLNSPGKYPISPTTQPMPTITAVDPPTFAHGGGTQITITGVNLIPQSEIDAGNLRVYIGKDVSTLVLATLVSATPTQIVVTVPAITGTGVPYSGLIQIQDVTYAIAGLVVAQDNLLTTVT